MGGLAAVGVLAMLPFGPTHALTAPMGGAVPLPGDFAMSLPFPEGTPVRASCAYGPGCSTYHVNTNVACCTNDYYALDLVRDQAGGGDGEPVTAMAAGTVIYADWATGGFSSFGRYVAIEHDDNADGHTYYSIYAHLSSIAVGVGEHVQMKQAIGNLGGSSNMLDDQFGAHVHVAVYQDATLGNGGMHGGLAVVAEPLDTHEDFMHGSVMVAGGGPPPAPRASTGTDAGDDSGDVPGDTGAGSATSGPDGGTSDPGGGTGDEGGADGASGDDEGDDAPGGDGDGTAGQDGGGEALPDAAGSRGDDGGCACASSPGPAPAPAPLAAAMLTWLFVRRRN